MVQSFNISFYHCTDVIMHAYRFLDVLGPFMMVLMLLCIMWDSLMLWIHYLVIYIYFFCEHNWCYCYVMYYFFIFSSGIVNSILSHICGRLYFPMFLFRVGLLTLINMASCMVLAKLFSSLPMILKLFIDVIWPLVFWCVNIGEGFFKCSLYLSPKVLPLSPIYSLSQSISPQQYL